MSITRRDSQGFTLIEVVLVLAIGGLIFLLAFLAYNQVARNRKESQRRQHARQVMTEIENYMLNSNGQTPCYDSGTWGCASATWTSFVHGHYYKLNLKDPDTGAAPGILGWRGVDHYMNLSSWLATSTQPVGTIGYSIKAQCENGNLNTKEIYTESEYGVIVKLAEGKTFCVDNS